MYNQTNAQVQPANGFGSNSTLGRAPTSSSIDAAVDHLTSLNGRLYEQISRARSIADAYFGPAPEAHGSGAVGASPSSKSEALNVRAKDFEDMLNALSIQLDRLTCI